MQFLARDQQQVLNNFISRTRKLIEFGFIHSFSDKGFKKNLECSEKAINLLKSLQNPNAAVSNCYTKCLEHEYIRYIIKLVRGGLKYVKNNPEYFEEVSKVQQILNDYEKTVLKSKKNTKMQPKNQEPVEISNSESDDAFREIYENIASINERFDKIAKTKNNLNNTFATSKQFKRSYDCLKKFNENVTNKLNQIQSAKKNRMQQQKKCSEKFDTSMPLSKANDYFLHDLDEDSEELNQESEEVIMSNEIYNNPQPAQLGIFEKCNRVPVYVDEDSEVPEIKSHAYFEKLEDGMFVINMKLEFDKKVFCDGKKVNEIKIRNFMPNGYEM